jgi:hypothetical protein
MLTTRTKSEDVAIWLGQAADYIESHGWWRGALRGPNRKQVCSLGAILFCRGYTGGDQYHPEVQEVCTAVCSAIGAYKLFEWTDPQSINELTEWNDNCCTNKQMAVDTFRKAEKIERAGFDPDA